jgi:NAD(P)-dependent dehydrogenase (short-subunit alcohol dehydrogenase family)
VLELSFEEWQRVIAVNLSGTFLPSQAFARRLVAQGRPGRIVNLASTLGLMAAPQRAAYVASKHGVVGLTKQMAMEFGAQNIRVNAVAPGVVRTPLTERYFQDPEMAETIRGIHALGRWAEPAEIATAILFLAAEENGFITGTVLTVDGGWTAGKRM